MKRLTYLVTLPLLFTMALLPKPAFYLLTEFVRFLLYSVVGYRKQVVRENLRKSFPNKEPEELLVIEKQFYRHLSHLLLETFRLRLMNDKEADRSCYLDEKSLALVKEYKEKNKPLILAYAHTGNWEWSTATFGKLLGDKYVIVYRPLSNPWFDNYIKSLRERFGGITVPMAKTMRVMAGRKNEMTALVLVGDQTPPPLTAYWTKFLNQDTPFFNGIGKFAVKFKMDVHYLCFEKIRNGEYRISLKFIYQSEEGLTEDEVTERYVKALEEDIKKTPWMWLWSHRRWKHKKNHTDS